MSGEMTALAAQLERTTRANATDRVAKAMEAIIRVCAEQLRDAVRTVVDHDADTVVTLAVNDLRQALLKSVGPIAERQAMARLVERLTSEASA